MTETWMTRREVATHLKVSLRHTYTLDIPCNMLGRVPRFERAVVDAWVREHPRPDARRTKGQETFGPLRRPSKTVDEFSVRLRKALGR